MEPQLADLLAQSGRRVEISVAFALLWLAAADGIIDVNTHACLNGHYEAIPEGLDKSDTLLAIIAANDLDSFLLACRILHRELKQEEKNAFLELAIAVAHANGELTTSANHIVRLYGDLLGFSPDELQARYRERTGTELPEPGDLSSVLWWEAKEQRSFSEETHYFFSPGKRFSRAEAFAVLGLQKEAQSTDIKRAYRRLVQNYHPDRYEAQGTDARQVAESNFLRVQQAYEVLNK